MRPTPPLPLRRLSRRLPRRGPAALGALLLLAVAPRCAVPPAPDPPPRAAPPPPPSSPPPVTQSALRPSTAPDFPGQRVIVIHQADLFGQFEGKAGQAITIRALLMMSKTQPAVGNKGVLYVSPAGAAQGEAGWVPLGDVEVKQPLDADGRIQVKIVDDEKKFALPGKRPAPLPKNTRMRLR